MGGPKLGSSPIATWDAGERIIVFAIDDQGAVVFQRQHASSVGFDPVQSLGGNINRGGVPFVANFDVTHNIDGRLEVCAIATDNALYHISETTPGGPWSNWQNLGGSLFAAPPALGRNLDGRLEAFANRPDGTIWHIWQTAPGSWLGAGWAQLGTMPFVHPMIGRKPDGRMEIFGVSPNDGQIWHAWQTAPNDYFSPWNQLGFRTRVSNVDGREQQPMVVSNSDGRMEVFGIALNHGIDSAAQHTWQTAINSGWSDWDMLPRIVDDPWLVREFGRGFRES